MAFEESLRQITLPAAADFSTTGQWRFGTINSSGQIALASAAGRVDGVIQGNVDTAGHAVGVGIHGVSMIELGATLSAGASVQAGTSGVAVSGTTNAKAILIEGGVSGDIVPCLLLG